MLNLLGKPTPSNAQMCPATAPIKVKSLLMGKMLLINSLTTWQTKSVTISNPCLKKGILSLSNVKLNTET